MTELTIEQARALAPLVTAEEAVARVTAGALLIDVRSAAGRSTAGELAGATVVAKDEVTQRFSPGAPTVLASPEQPIVVVCGSERGSGPVAVELLGLGFTDVVQVAGGFPALKDIDLKASSAS